MCSHPASGGYRYRGLVFRDGVWAPGYQPYPVKKKIVQKPPRNSAGFFGGGQGLSWAVGAKEKRKKLSYSVYWCGYGKSIISFPFLLA
jgi:hypothetical protein